jgi:hydrogenase nickel incorporation protein HypA/HybF
MHELAICQALMNQIEHLAAERNARSVVSIVIGMGPLSGVEAQLLKHAYPVASAGTVAEGAELVIESLPVRVSCSQCGAESEALPNKLVCKACGDWRTTLISGDELMLMSVELERNAAHRKDIDETDKPGLTVH